MELLNRIKETLQTGLSARALQVNEEEKELLAIATLVPAVRVCVDGVGVATLPLAVTSTI